MREGRHARGVRRTVVRRARVEQAMRDAGDGRLQQAHRRQGDELARRLEASESQRGGGARPAGGGGRDIAAACGHAAAHCSR